MIYNKLVRDRIPEIITESGMKAATHIADAEEYHSKLRLKLQEEVDEFLADENIEELADILEVLYALCDDLKIERTSLEQIRKAKANERGEIKDKIIFEATSLDL